MGKCIWYKSFINQPHYQIFMLLFLENLKIIPDSKMRNIVSKGPKYRFPSRIDFNRCREEIASSLNDLGNRW